MLIAVGPSSTMNSTGRMHNMSGKITLTGTCGLPGTIAGLVYGPMSSDGSCTDVNWVGAPEFAPIAPIVTTGDGTYVTKAITRDSKGCYTFAEKWTSADHSTVVANSEAGQVSETLFFSQGRGGNLSLIHI